MDVQAIGAVFAATRIARYHERFIPRGWSLVVVDRGDSLDRSHVEVGRILYNDVIDAIALRQTLILLGLLVGCGFDDLFHASSCS